MSGGHSAVVKREASAGHNTVVKHDCSKGQSVVIKQTAPQPFPEASPTPASPNDRTAVFGTLDSMAQQDEQLMVMKIRYDKVRMI